MIFENLTVSVDDLPLLNNNDFIPLEPKYKQYLVIRNSIFFIVFSVIIVIANIF